MKIVSLVGDKFLLISYLFGCGSLLFHRSAAANKNMLFGTTTSFINYNPVTTNTAFIGCTFFIPELDLFGRRSF